MYMLTCLVKLTDFHARKGLLTCLLLIITAEMNMEFNIYIDCYFTEIYCYHN